MLVYSFNSKGDGSYIDSVTKVVGVNTNGVFSKREKGLSWIGDGVTGTKIDFGTNSNWNFTNNILSIDVWVKIKETKAQRIFGTADLGSPETGFVLEMFSNNIYFGIAEGTTANLALTPAVFNKWIHLIGISDGTNNYIYIDSILGTLKTINGSGVQTENLTIAGDDNVNRYGNIDVAKATIYNHVLTPKERADAYKSFLNAGPLGKTLRLDYSSLRPTDLSNEPGLIAAYNMIPSADGVLVDISGEGNNGTINGAVSSRDGLVFDGEDDVVNMDDVNEVEGINSITIVCRFKHTGSWVTREFLVSKTKISSTATDSFQLGAGNGVFWGVSNGTITATVDMTDPSPDLWHDVVATYNGSQIELWLNGISQGTAPLTGNINNSTRKLKIGGSDSLITFFNGEIADAKIYNRAFTEAQAIAYHNSFAKRVALRESFDYDGIGNVPKEWIPGTGTYSVQELTAQDSVLKHLDVGTKYLNCDGAGTMAIPSKKAYGEWEFDLYKGGGSNTSLVYFILNKQVAITTTGYVFYIDSSEGLNLHKVGVAGNDSLWASPNVYTTIDTWYRIKIIRTFDGEFYSYIKGGVFGDNDWTLISVVGGSGSNPETDNTHIVSEYFVLDFDAGDRIANIKITEGVKQ